MSSNKTVKISLIPAPGVLTAEGIGAANLGLANALGEIVANCCDWHLLSEEEAELLHEAANTVPLAEKRLKALNKEYGALEKVTSSQEKTVKVLLEDKDGDPKIIIIDNGVGMEIDDLEIALQLRRASDEKRTPLRFRKGMFGMGLKAGWLTLGHDIEIHTKSIKSSKTIFFTLESKSFAKKDTWDDVDVIISSDSSPYLDDQEHGTVIVISNLMKKNHDWNAGREGLELAFSAELETGLKMDYDGTECKYEEPELDSRIPKLKLDDLDLFVAEDLGAGERGELVQIRGWVGLVKKAEKANAGRFGVHTTRRGQLIEAWHHDGSSKNGLWPYPNPHADHRRIFGWIHLDMVPPNFHKKGWNTDSPAWADVIEILENFLSPITEYAGITLKDKKKQAEYQKTWSKFISGGTWEPPTPAKKKRGKKKKGGGEEENGGDEEEEEVGPFSIRGANHKYLEPMSHHEEVSVGDPPWSYTCDNNEIILHVYLEHPIFKACADVSFLTKLAKIDAFCSIMLEHGFSNAEVDEKREKLYWTLMEG
ncbi:MAG: hypothetical protein HOE69_07505 [Euryarchaeota archaeon]|jgi:hypothetical protein|nr:hypothetical protein [Euryarchaeota archaeon]